MKIGVIKSKTEYEEACQRIYDLINANNDPILPGSSEADEIELLSLLVEKYEREQYRLKAPDPIEAIRFRMDQMNLKQKDIAPLFGGKTRVSEVLNKRRPLSMKMIILLNRYLGIPLESLMTDSTFVKLTSEERELVLGVPSISEYVNSILRQDIVAEE